MSILIPSFNSPGSDFEKLVSQCPNKIARGSTRDVFEIPDHPDKVLKSANVPTNYANWAEMVVYHSADENQRFFAKVHSISWSGKFLVMERLSRVTFAEVSPVLHTFPRFINDRKPVNFGKDSEGNIKMLDYALVNLGPPPETFAPSILSPLGG
ncbi:hypothetical protein [Hydrogenophaga sp. BPS33]|uniref:hypothetical protein n=1 Tax=Hydrogenophaga sp. BPS33 TaxID=2651974 RepID=UPI0013200D7B|nr:hypothetical protein [Hydrogenophaga sp. BPS33]QHE87231.1 hypothetical protein F9K07_21185 [Hydrogenophaga sp. BPS33]